MNEERSDGRFKQKEKGVNLPREFLDRVKLVAMIKHMTIKEFIVDIFCNRVFRARKVECPNCQHQFVIEDDYAVALQMLQNADKEQIIESGLNTCESEVKHALC